MAAAKRVAQRTQEAFAEAMNEELAQLGLDITEEPYYEAAMEAVGTADGPGLGHAEALAVLGAWQ